MYKLFEEKIYFCTIKMVEFHRWNTDFIGLIQVAFRMYLSVETEALCIRESTAQCNFQPAITR